MQQPAYYATHRLGGRTPSFHALCHLQAFLATVPAFAKGCTVITRA